MTDYREPPAVSRAESADAPARVPIDRVAFGVAAGLSVAFVPAGVIVGGRTSVLDQHEQHLEFVRLHDGIGA